MNNDKKIVLTAQIGPNLDVFVSRFFLGKSNYLYVFDCWEKYLVWLIPLSKTFRINTIYFSAKQAKDLFLMAKSNKTPTKAIWIPEGIQMEDYKFLPYNKKKIDILEFGRKHELLHNKIKNALIGTNYYHLYQIEGAPPLFPDRATFLEGLAKSKICICVPSNITHPNRAGQISTMTLRYLQAMASKCLVVGVMPYDMRELFNYDPMVEIDINNINLEIQIFKILENYENYIPLIEKNYHTVINHHTWETRIAKMLNYMDS